MVIEELTAGDVAWAADLMERRRQEYARYSPVFWHPAADVTDLHARYLRRQIESEANVGLRTEHGFIISESREAEGFVDDFAVDRHGSWDREGAALLIAACERLAARHGLHMVRVVTAHADLGKSRMLGNLSLQLVEQWWVRELGRSSEHAPPGRVEGPGFTGILGPAPPVYDPGGPVFIVESIADNADAAAIEGHAAALGAVLAVVPASPDSARAADLLKRSWSVASDWYRGWPVGR